MTDVPPQPHPYCTEHDQPFERCDHDRLQGFERDLTQAETEALAERFAEAQRNGKITVLPDDTDRRIAEAVAAERERITQLAIDHDATIMAECDDCQRKHHKHLFADLIRQETP